MSQPLFDGYPDPDPDDGLSRDARRTARQHALIDQGIHPATRRSIVDDGRTCGDCAHLLVRHRSGTWFKCVLQLHDGQGLDIRKSWPACTEWRPDGPP